MTTGEIANGMSIERVQEHLAAEALAHERERAGRCRNRVDRDRDRSAMTTVK